MLKKICFVINNRANYARTKSLILKIKKDKKFKLQLVLGASSLLQKFGELETVIRKDNLNVTDKFYSIIEGGNNLTMVKSTAVTLGEISNIFSRIKPDLVFVIADRFENLSVAIAASYMNIPLAHIQGGELTGSIDEKVRHAITKLSDIHFVCTKRSKDFVVKMGENKKIVFNTGCPSLDLIEFKKIRDFSDLELKKIKVQLNNKKYIVVVQHPVTNEVELLKNQIKSTLKSVINICNKKNIKAIWLWPNVDAGTDVISKELRIFKDNSPYKNKILFIKNLSPENYLKLIYNSLCLIGNSSSGIRESSYLGLPVVNIGGRQIFREISKNVINSDFNSKKIINAINFQIKKNNYKKSNLYGDGKAANKILKILKKIKFIDIKKKINYI